MNRRLHYYGLPANNEEPARGVAKWVQVFELAIFGTLGVLLPFAAADAWNGLGVVRARVGGLTCVACLLSAAICVVILVLIVSANLRQLYVSANGGRAWGEAVAAWRSWIRIRWVLAIALSVAVATYSYLERRIYFMGLPQGAMVTRDGVPVDPDVELVLLRSQSLVAGCVMGIVAGVGPTIQMVAMRLTERRRRGSGEALSH